MMSRSIHSRAGICLLGIVALGALIAPSNAQELPALARVPADVVAREPQFVTRRASLRQERDRLHGEFVHLTADCRAVDARDNAHVASCRQRQGALASALARHRVGSDQFNNAVAIAAMTALAGRLDWSAADQADLRDALVMLRGDGDPNVDGRQIRNAWQDILARGQDPALQRLSDQGGGPGFPAAGQQMGAGDCAVFALANAANLPYGVVGARAAELIRQGTWRSAAERANPQHTIETRGLVGGEVVILAKMFGNAAVVRSEQFAAALREGRRIMINVVPENGDLREGHEVVLSRTFQHGGGAWYEMIDSHQGPMQRLYVSAQELDIILQERGVAFTPARGTVPQLLR